MRTWMLLLGALLPVLFSGCANKALVRYEKIAKQAASQNYQVAIDRIRKDRSSLYGSQSELLFHMDVGLLFHYAALYDSSNFYLQKAVRLKDELYAKSVTQEAATFLTNDNIRPYRGKQYEITWLHLIMAFNYLAQDKNDDARVEVRQAQLFLDEVKRKAGSDSSSFRDDGLFRTVAALIYEALGEQDDALISLYQAVKAYKDAHLNVPAGLARYAYTALSTHDRQNDVQTLGLTTPNLDQAATFSPTFGQTEIIVVGELGQSPTLGETVFWGTWVRDGILVFHYRDAKGNIITEALPAPGLPPSAYGKNSQGGTRSGTTFHVKWAMPSLREVSSQSQYLRVVNGTTPFSGETYADTHDLVSQDLTSHRASTLTRTIVRVVARTMASETTKSALNTGNPLVNLLLNIGTDVLGDQLEQADTRLWFLLPRSMQITRIPVKPGRITLTLTAEGRGQTVSTETRTIEVKLGQKKFVFFTSLK